MGAEEDRASVGNFGDVADELHPCRREGVNDKAVVDKFVEAVDCSVRSRDRLFGYLNGVTDAEAESVRFGQDYFARHLATTL